MPRGKVLKPEERAQIAELHAAGVSGREIAKRLHRSKTVVLNFLRAPTQYASTKRSGRKRALSGADEARLYAALFRPVGSHAEVDEATETQTHGGTTHAQTDAVGAVRPVKKSAEQIKREFNLPLSVRRIQQLLCEWRRQAQRQQSEQRIQQSQDTNNDDNTGNCDAVESHKQPTAVDKAQAPSNGDAVPIPIGEETQPAAQPAAQPALPAGEDVNNMVV